MYFWWGAVEGADGYFLYQDTDDCPVTPGSSYFEVYNFTSFTLPKWLVDNSDCFAV